MIKTILAAGTAMVLTMGAAHAEPVSVVVDDFTDAQSVTDSTVGDGGMETSMNVSTTFADSTFTHVRSLSVTQTMHDTQAQDNNESMAEIGQGTLGLTNDDFVNAEFGLRYELDQGLVDAISGSTNLTLRVLFSDLVGEGEQPFLIEAFLNDEEIGEQAITTRTADVSFELSDFLEAGNVLSFRFSGDWGYDATLGPISVMIEGDTAGEVPEPAALGLFGLGLMGVAAARRRKARA